MELMIPKEFYWSSFSILILVVGALVALMTRDKKESASFSKSEVVQILFLSLSFFASVFNCEYGVFLGGAFVFNKLTKIAHLLILSISLFISFLFLFHPERKRFFSTEISFLYLVVTCGMLIFTSSYDFITLVIALEISSLGGYTLIGYLNPGRKSLEGAIKYFMLGSIASAFLLLGVAFIYAATGSLNLADIAEFAQTFAHPSWLRGGLVLLLLGLAFKLALAPFHFWAPDAYESAPTGITAFMATGFKVIILTVFIRIFTLSFSFEGSLWSLFFSILIVFSIIVGNLMALTQFSVKRTLAYSSIAHSGYMAIALAALSTPSTPVTSLYFYLTSYTLASLIAFGALMFMESQENQNLSLDDIKGYSKKSPTLAFLLSFSLLSLAGLPPTVGFLGKLFLFNSAIKGSFVPLVLVAILGSAVSLYYYLRIIVQMYMKEEDRTCLHPARAPKRKPLLLMIPFLIALLLGTIWPERFMQTLDSRPTTSIHK